jgi:hypothetical protein
MQKLINLILQNNPDFATEVEGVSDDEIQDLQKYVPNPIPEEYKAFLRIMGKKKGRVKGLRKVIASHGLDRPTTIEESEIQLEFTALLQTYKKSQEFFKTGLKGMLQDSDTPNEDPKSYFLFGLDTRGNDNGDFYLDLRTPDLRVVEITPTFGVIERSPSLREFLFKDSFKRDLSYYEHNKEWL